MSVVAPNMAPHRYHVILGNNRLNTDRDIGEGGDKVFPERQKFVRTVNGLRRRVPQAVEHGLRVQQLADCCLAFSIPNLLKPAVDQSFIGNGHGEGSYKDPWPCASEEYGNKRRAVSER